MPDNCSGNCLNLLSADRARDDPQRQHRLPSRTRQDVNDSAPCARHLPLISPCSVSPAQHNASLPGNLLAGVRSGFRRRIDSRGRASVLPDSGPVCEDKTIDAVPGTWLRSAVCSPRQSVDLLQCLNLRLHDTHVNSYLTTSYGCVQQH